MRLVVIKFCGLMGFSLAGIHAVLALGLRGWLKPQAWPAGMPSISLLAFIAALVPPIVRRKLSTSDKSGKQKRGDQIR